MKQRGFSLMEMMIVLLIVAIIAAASAPMVSKKMMRDAEGGSPWMYAGLGGSITYNPDGNQNKTAMVGTGTLPSNAGKSKFYIESSSTEPQIALGTSGSSNVMNVTSKNYGIRISESKSGDVSSHSVGIGYKSEASGISAIALGSYSNAINNHAIALGLFAKADGAGAALGRFANAGVGATALGSFANASENYAIALGYNTTAGGDSAVALGHNTTAGRSNSIAIGRQSIASGSYATALGCSSNASGYNSTAIGSFAKASGAISTAFGDFANASGGYSTSLGASSIASASYSSALGWGANASGYYSTALVGSAKASGNYSIALGYKSNASGSYSTALGYNSNATQSYATALGASSVAKNSYSTAVGYGATTSASNQIVLGSSSTTVYIPGRLVVGGNAYIGDRLQNAQCLYLGMRHNDDSGIKMRKISMRGDLGGKNNDQNVFGDGTVSAIYGKSSDRRLKNVGEVFTGGLNKIKQLKVYNYTFKEDENKTPRVGVMAQDLQKVFPDAVTKGENGFLRIRWEDMFYALINAVKELDLRVTSENRDLKKRVTELEKQNKRLEERLSKLESKVFN